MDLELHYALLGRLLTQQCSLCKTKLLSKIRSKPRLRFEIITKYNLLGEIKIFALCFYSWLHNLSIEKKKAFIIANYWQTVLYKPNPSEWNDFPKLFAKFFAIENETCCICFLALTKASRSKKCITCKQTNIHQSCLDIWCKTNNSCPLCRSKIGNLYDDFQNLLNSGRHSDFAIPESFRYDYDYYLEPSIYIDTRGRYRIRQISNQYN